MKNAMKKFSKILSLLLVLSMLLSLSAFATEIEEETAPAEDILSLLDYDAAMVDAEYLVETIGVRLTGTKAEIAGLDYIEAQYAELGYEIARQDFTLETRTSGDIYIGDMIIAAGTPSKNDAYSGFGEAEGVPVLLADPAEVATLGEDLSGVIVFMLGNCRTARVNGATAPVDQDTYDAIAALNAAPAAGIVVMMDPTTEDTERYQIRVSTPNFQTVGMEISTPTLITNAMDAEKLVAYLSENPEALVKMEGRNYVNSQNLIVTKKAAVETDMTIYVTCHIDSVLPSPGANDNASGVVGILAMARAFKDIETNYNIQFITFGAEEVGLQGAEYFAQNLTEQEILDAIGNYNLDMVATSQEDCVYIFMNSSTNPSAPVNDASLETHVTRMSRNAAIALGYDVEYYRTCYDRTTDHYALHKVGIPAVEFDWRANAEGTSFEAYYHTRYDDFEHNFSKEKLKKQLDAITLAVYNDATADYVAVVGEGVYREYYTTLTEAFAAAGEEDTVRLLKTFEDVSEEAWYSEAVNYVVSKGLMIGTSNTEFKPESKLTRAMLVTTLYRMAGSPTVEETAPFTDVEEGAWYAEAVAWAYANGIAQGMTAETFAPNKELTREQMVTFLYRYAKVTGIEIVAFTDYSKYDDAEAVSGYAAVAMSWAIAENIIQGVSGDKLAPRGTATRAQVAAVIMRLALLAKNAA